MSTNDELAWEGINLALGVLNDWYEANLSDYFDDEQTPHGLTMRELGDALDAAFSLASQRGTAAA